MGLDQYAYVAAKAGQMNEHYEGEGVYIDGEWKPNSGVPKPREIAYWRKHPGLQGWMEKLWLRKQSIPTDASDQFIEGHMPRTFNGVEVELTWQDLDDLERAVTHSKLPNTRGFFFGDPSDEYYREHDLKFIKEARAEIFLGLKVFYNSSW